MGVLYSFPAPEVDAKILFLQISSHMQEMSFVNCNVEKQLFLEKKLNLMKV